MGAECFHRLLGDIGAHIGRCTLYVQIMYIQISMWLIPQRMICILDVFAQLLIVTVIVGRTFAFQQFAVVCRQHILS